MEWTSNGPRSNLESGLVPGGRSVGGDPGVKILPVQKLKPLNWWFRGLIQKWNRLFSFPAPGKQRRIKKSQDRKSRGTFFQNLPAR